MRRRKRVEIRRVNLKRVYEELFKRVDKISKGGQKRGRPRKYKESLIYFALALKVVQRLSYRDLEHQLKALNLFGEVPDFSSLLYRFKRLNERVLGYFIKKVANSIKTMRKIEYSIIDATGFGFGEDKELRFKRGEELRRVQSHIRLQSIVGITQNGYVFIDAFFIGQAYASENRMLRAILENFSFSSKIVLADALYSTNSLAKYLLQKGYFALIPTKDTLRQKVKNPYRKKLKALYEENKVLYKKRNLIENFFAKIKNSFGDKEPTSCSSLAKKFVLMKLLLLNFATLIALLFLVLVFFKHTQSSFL